MAKLTPLAISALALLVERPMHPYEMYQLQLQRGEDRMVKVRPGSLYHTVSRLAGDGLVEATGTEREGNRPERTVYDITDQGRTALGNWVAEMLAAPVREYPSFPPAIAEAHTLPVATVVQLLRRRTAAQRADADVLGSILDNKKHLQRAWFLQVEYLQVMLRAEVAWLEGVIADLESGAMTW